MHIWESENAYRLIREKMSAYLGNEPSCVIKREGVSAQLRNNFEHVIEQNKNNHAWQLNQSIHQSIIKSLMCQSPFIFA